MASGKGFPPLAINVSVGDCVHFPELLLQITTTGGIRTSEIYDLLTLQARNSNSRYWQAMLPLKVLGENHSLPLLVSGVCWQSLVSLGLWQHQSTTSVLI
jgi:hypothetical protein